MLDFNQIKSDFEKNRKKILDGLNLDNKPLRINDRRGEGDRERVEPTTYQPASLNRPIWLDCTGEPPVDEFTKLRLDEFYRQQYFEMTSPSPVWDKLKKISNKKGLNRPITDDDIVNFKIELNDIKPEDFIDT
jgi:hypothetical protein